MPAPQPAHVEDETHAPVAENSSPGDSRYLSQSLAKTFDDHFLFTDEIVDQQTEWTPIALSNNQECLTGIFGSGSNAKPLVQPQHRQQPFTHHYHFLTVLHTEHGAG